MIVLGGTYQERCEFPHYKKLFGPGLRGVCAIQELTSNPNELYTLVGPQFRDELEMKSATYDFNYEARDLTETVSFHYLHNHSNPNRYWSELQNPVKLGPIDGKAIMRFGFVEGSAVVDGTRVVYDPQSSDEERFHENGSQAEELAIVLNRHEAQSVSGKEGIDDMLDYLTEGSDLADVVVVKCGASGAVVRTHGETQMIAPYETEKVWGIGSGDVFSAVFSAYWADQGRPAIEAANKASLATAYYCTKRLLPIPTTPEDEPGFKAQERSPTVDEEGPSIYLAAPFFDIGELWLVEEVRRILRKAGAEVISPYHDIGRSEDYDDEMIAKRDLEAINEADVVFAMIDHTDPGTFIEIGAARNAGTPVIAYQNEPSKHRTTMLKGSGCELYDDLSTAVYKALWAGS